MLPRHYSLERARRRPIRLHHDAGTRRNFVAGWAKRFLRLLADGGPPQLCREHDRGIGTDRSEQRLAVGRPCERRAECRRIAPFRMAIDTAAICSFETERGQRRSTGAGSEASSCSAYRCCIRGFSPSRPPAAGIGRCVPARHRARTAPRAAPRAQVCRARLTADRPNTQDRRAALSAIVRWRPCPVAPDAGPPRACSPLGQGGAKHRREPRRGPRGVGVGCVEGVGTVDDHPHTVHVRPIELRCRGWARPRGGHPPAAARSHPVQRDAIRSAKRSHEGHSRVRSSCPAAHRRRPLCRSWNPRDTLRTAPRPHSDQFARSRVREAVLNLRATHVGASPSRVRQDARSRHASRCRDRAVSRSMHPRPCRDGAHRSCSFHVPARRQSRQT